MRLVSIALGFALVWGCALSESPAVRPCASPNEPEGRSTASLSILPSLAAGVEIASASWRTSVSRDAGIPTEYLILTTTLQSGRRVTHDEIAIVYDAPGPHAIVDDLLLEPETGEHRLGIESPLLESGQRKSAMRFERLRSAYWLGQTSALGYCPRAVRVVPRRLLSVALTPDLGTTGGQRSRLARLPEHDAGSLVVLMDTLVTDAPASSLVVGTALNVTDSTLSDLVVGLVVSRPTARDDAQVENEHTSLDTLEYLIDSVRPHALAPFAGGFLDPRERIVKRAVYRVADVFDREIAGPREFYRASAARQATTARSLRRDACRTNTTTCAD
jgi:hypothetical protein